MAGPRAPNSSASGDADEPIRASLHTAIRVCAYGFIHMSALADPNRQFDLFVPFVADLPLRDQRETMERPFFSLSKNKRIKPIGYTSPDGKVYVHISANPEFGMA